MKTDSKKMGDLFDEYADILRAAMKKDPNASVLNVVRQFLKDNGISARPTQGSPLGNLVDSLPTFADDDSDDQPFTN